MCVGAVRPAKKLRSGSVTQQETITIPTQLLQVKSQHTSSLPPPTTTPLDWRSGDLNASSDVDIHVLVDDGCSSDSKPQVYHAHEALIAHGPKKCAYFENLSHCMELQTSHKVIPVRLNEKTAKAFPTFLDYMYGSTQFQLTSDNVVAVRHLADMFKCIPLMSETWMFIRSNMGSKNYEQYLEDAQRLGDKQTSSWVAFGCAQDIHTISPTSKIWKLMPLHDFTHMMQLTYHAKIGHSQLCSEIVAAYLHHHNLDDVDEMAFKEMTSSRVLPEISPKVAMFLMKTEYHVRKASLEAKAQHKTLSSLQRRCMSILKQ